MRLPMVLLTIAACAVSAHAACPPSGHDRDRLAALRENAFALPDADVRNALAVDLLDCLGAPDPDLRDGIAFEALSTWLRADRVDPFAIDSLALEPQP